MYSAAENARPAIGMAYYDKEILEIAKKKDSTGDSNTVTPETPESADSDSDKKEEDIKCDAAA